MNIFQRIANYAQQVFNRTPYREPKEWKPAVNPNRNERDDNPVVEWCRNFNRRNGNVVPPVSTESIARHAVKFRKRGR